MQMKVYWVHMPFPRPPSPATPFIHLYRGAATCVPDTQVSHFSHNTASQSSSPPPSKHTSIRGRPAFPIHNLPHSSVTHHPPTTIIMQLKPPSPHTLSILVNSRFTSALIHIVTEKHRGNADALLRKTQGEGCTCCYKYTSGEGEDVQLLSQATAFALHHLHALIDV